MFLYSDMLTRKRNVKVTNLEFFYRYFHSCFYCVMLFNSDIIQYVIYVLIWPWESVFCMGCSCCVLFCVVLNIFQIPFSCFADRLKGKVVMWLNTDGTEINLFLTLSSGTGGGHYKSNTCTMYQVQYNNKFYLCEAYSSNKMQHNTAASHQKTSLTQPQ